MRELHYTQHATLSTHPTHLPHLFPLLYLPTRKCQLEFLRSKPVKQATRAVRLTQRWQYATAATQPQLLGPRPITKCQACEQSSREPERG